MDDDIAGTSSSPDRSQVALQVCSDLHLESWHGSNRQRVDVWQSLVVPSTPYIALLGDISTPGMLESADSIGPDNFSAFLRWLSKRFVRVFVILGNHELFSLSRRYEDEPGRAVDVIISNIIDICDALPGVELLNRRSFVVDDSVRLIGATLWSDIDLSQQMLVALVENSISDYHRVVVHTDGVGRRLLTVGDTVRWHREDCLFIRQEILEAQRLGQQAVVLTHHSPSIVGTCKPEYIDSVLNCAFATNLDLLAMKGVHTWVYGHTHWNARIRICDAYLVSNQLGYRIHDSQSECESGGIPYEPGFTIYI